MCSIVLRLGLAKSCLQALRECTLLRVEDTCVLQAMVTANGN